MSRPAGLVKLEVRKDSITERINNATWLAKKLIVDLTMKDTEGRQTRINGVAHHVGTGKFKHVYALPDQDLVVKQRFDSNTLSTEWVVSQQLSGCKRIARCYGEMTLEGNVHYTVMEYVPLSAQQFLMNLMADFEKPMTIVEGLRFVKDLLSLLFEVLFECNMIPWDFATQNFGIKNGKVICFDYDNWQCLDPERHDHKVQIWKVYVRLARDLPQQPVFNQPSLLKTCVQALNGRVDSAKRDYVYLECVMYLFSFFPFLLFCLLRGSFDVIATFVCLFACKECARTGSGDDGNL